MEIDRQKLEQIRERWSEKHWATHERAFTRQWMEQANRDTEELIELVLALADLQEQAGDLADNIGEVVDSFRGDEDAGS